jgi:flavin-dependent dehydrogenase
MAIKCDVLVIGGGPAGSTVATLLKKYKPELDILIVERENFPRDHIGESQLTAVCLVLNEMGVWDKVEAAGFPVKIGSTYRWGKTDELWQINFLLDEQFKDEPRPGKFEGQRALTAFQVDRSIYDKILLDHAQSMGCKVMEGVKALSIRKEGDKILDVTLAPSKGGGPSEVVEARYYIDASASGFIRRDFDVEVESPTCLRNVALWHYWRDTDWAETVGNAGTRAQILSIGWGWIWFIPIGKTRTSIGVVTPASHLKASGKTPQELYMEGLASEPRVTKLLELSRGTPYRR